MITLRNVSKWYGSFQVLTDCSTEVKKGEVVVVCGPSGSGKSTLIKCVNGLEPFQKGEIIVDGISVGDPKTNLPKLRSRVGMVFQHFELFPHMTVMENLTLGQTKVLGRSEEEALAAAQGLCNDKICKVCGVEVESVALEPVSSTTSRDPSGAVENRSGFLPAGNVSP